jgi:hypothetical protein
MEKYGILGMHAVLSLLKYYRIRRLNHSICHFNTSLCRQTMHEICLWSSSLHHSLIHLPDQPTANKRARDAKKENECRNMKQNMGHMFFHHASTWLRPGIPLKTYNMASCCKNSRSGPYLCMKQTYTKPNTLGLSSNLGQNIFLKVVNCIVRTWNPLKRCARIAASSFWPMLAHTSA